MVSRKMILILIFTFFYIITSSFASNPSYNVKSFGANSDANSDSTKAFLSAWSAACATTQPAAIYIPPGRYLLRNALWLKFQKVAGLSISGGTLDGQGTKLWACKNSSKSCPKGAASLAFYSSNNISIDSLSSLNSQMFHILIYNCHNANLNNVKISAPVNSPNTDGIHLQQSSGVTITNSRVGTGDDCVSIGPGTSNLWIENLSCGPAEISQLLHPVPMRGERLLVMLSPIVASRQKNSSPKMYVYVYQVKNGNN